MGSEMCIRDRGKQGEVSRLLVDDHLTLSFGLGDSDEIDEDAVRRAAGALARNLTGVERATITTELGIRPIVEGLLLGGYSYTGLKAQPEEETAPTRITVVGSDSAESRAEFDRAVIIAESALLARDLVNTPGNFLYPETYARIMEEAVSYTHLRAHETDS